MTISAERRAHIRRLYYAEHWKVGTIAEQLGVHHQTVRRAIGAERFSGSQSRVAASVLDPYKRFIEDVLAQHPRLRATRLFEMLRARGYAGSTVIVRRYVRTVRPLPREAFFQLETMPGEQGQVDWCRRRRISAGI